MTLDAAGTEVKIAQLIVQCGGHYVLALKANHRHLHEDVAAYFAWLDKQEEQAGVMGLEWQESVRSEGGHGRFEKRRVRAVSAPNIREFVNPSVEQWPDLQSVVMVERKRKNRVRGQENVTVKRSCYLSSLPARQASDGERLGHAIRAHWSIENGQHWVLDVVWQEDACRVGKDQRPSAQESGVTAPHGEQHHAPGQHLRH